MRPGECVVIRRGEPHGRAHGGEDRGGHVWSLGMMGGPATPLSAGAEVLLPGTEADGVADAMIEARQNICGQ